MKITITTTAGYTSKHTTTPGALDYDVTLNIDGAIVKGGVTLWRDDANGMGAMGTPLEAWMSARLIEACASVDKMATVYVVKLIEEIRATCAKSGEDGGTQTLEIEMEEEVDAIITTNAAYLDLFTSPTEATEFENQCLSIGHDLLPASALAVLEDRSADPAPEYWTWLANQLSL